MLKRATLRRRLAWAALVVLLCSVVASPRMLHRGTEPAATPATCVDSGIDSVRFARVAMDTIADLRGRSQRVTQFTATQGGIEVRTEDSDPLSAHDGGLVAFDCAGRPTFLWLDGG